VHRTPGFPDLQRCRRRHRIRIGLPPAGETFGGLGEEVKVGLHGVPLTPDLHCRRRALQLSALDALPAGAHRRSRHARQRGHLGHLQKESGHRKTHLDQPEQTGCTGHLLADRFTPIRRCSERGHHRVPD